MNVEKILRKSFRPALTAGLAACLVVGAAEAAPVSTEAPLSESAAQSMDAARESSLQPIVGTWREAGDPEPRVLTIYADGAYELVYPEGKAFGKVKVTAEEHPGGEKTLWYSFYEIGGVTLEDTDTDAPWYAAFTSANELWAAFAKDGAAATQTDLRSGHDGALHFVRGEESGYHETGKNVKADDYLGVWGCGRATAVISREATGYRVEIQWAKNAAEGSRWVYQCTYDNYAALFFSNGNGTRTDYTFTEDGNGTDMPVYNDGRATFVLRKGKLAWKDEKENAGEDMEFVKSP